VRQQRPLHCFTLLLRPNESSAFILLFFQNLSKVLLRHLLVVRVQRHIFNLLPRIESVFSSIHSPNNPPAIL
jgi:hypothetical protein